MGGPFPEQRVRQIVVALLLAVLLWLGYSVLRPFLVPVTWAVVIASASWPLYRPLQHRLRRRAGLSALVMTALVAAALVLPAVWLVALLHDEVALAFGALRARLEAGPFELPEAVRSLPLIGTWLQELTNQATRDPVAFRARLTDWVGEGGEHLLALLGDMGRNAAKLVFAIVTLFFLYRDGERLYGEVRRLLTRFIGTRLDRYLAAVGMTTRAVVWGLVAAALVQGFVAGIGYWWAGVPAPVLAGAITAMVALIPFGTPFAWGAVAAWLLATGKTAEGLGLLLWGVLVVSWVDNLLRPMVISNAAHIPFVVVLFGVLGGLASFGLVGLFLGPLILAVLMAMWREWIEESQRGLIPARRPEAPRRPEGD